MPSGEREATYYIRHRGRTTGPFPAGELARFVRRGALGRFHEVSRDGQAWTPAAAVPGLFGGFGGEAPETPIGPTTSSADAGPMVFYAAGADTFGPMPLSLLAALVRAGKVPADSHVWSDADPQQYPLHRHPLLSHVDLPDTSAVPDGTAPRPRGGGCGLMLIVFAVLCLAAGVYLAIDLSSTDKESKKAKTPPATLRSVTTGPADTTRPKGAD